jgi:hypothetical protein
MCPGRCRRVVADTPQLGGLDCGSLGSECDDRHRERGHSGQIHFADTV